MLDKLYLLNRYQLYFHYFNFYILKLVIANHFNNFNYFLYIKIIVILLKLIHFYFCIIKLYINLVSNFSSLHQYLIFSIIKVQNIEPSINEIALYYQ